MKISQTMIVPDFHGELSNRPTEPVVRLGREIKFSAGIRPPTKGAKPKPNLILDHCTMEGAGLFDLTSSRGPAPYPWL